eukprot:scaffold2418_cov115-Isochrysis_galbana.AAC.3
MPDAELLVSERALLAHDVGGDLLRLGHVLDDDVVLSHRGGRHRFLVSPLAVNHRRHVLLRVLVHSGPHLGDPRARGVHHRHAARDHHVAVGDIGEALAFLRLLNKVDVHVAQQVVDARVVDQLVGDVHRLIRVRVPRRPCQLDRPLHAPAEAVVLGQTEDNGAVTLAPRHLAQRGLAHLLDQSGRKLLAHLARHVSVDRLVERSISALVLILRHDAPALGALIQRAGQRRLELRHLHHRRGGPRHDGRNRRPRRTAHLQAGRPMQQQSYR